MKVILFLMDCYPIVFEVLVIGLGILFFGTIAELIDRWRRL